MKTFCLITVYALLIFNSSIFGQTFLDTLVLKDSLNKDVFFPAASKVITVKSGTDLIQGFMYMASGGGKHPTLILLHGFPGNEKNLDLAQAVRSSGWNVIFFNYRGSWGSQGYFSFQNCVEDVINLVNHCKHNAEVLRVDINKISLFGHSMGGWVCLKALEKMPFINKGFVLSTWNLTAGLEDKKTLNDEIKKANTLFVLNIKSGKKLYKPVMDDPEYYNLINDGFLLSKKQLVMLDESNKNASIAHAISSYNKSYFNYEIWPTDHSFSNYRVALINKVIEFLKRDF